MFDQLRPAYVYLLGLYLGDGCISAHPRQVYKLRIVLDLKYPGIIKLSRSRDRRDPWKARARPKAPDPQLRRGQFLLEQSPCYLPQHGAGPKHGRRIWLAD